MMSVKSIIFSCVILFLMSDYCGGIPSYCAQERLESNDILVCKNIDKKSTNKCFKSRNWYYYFSGKCLNYAKAKKFCEDQNMNLARIKKFDNNIFLYESSCSLHSNEATWTGAKKFGTLMEDWKNFDESKLPGGPQRYFLFDEEMKQDGCALWRSQENGVSWYSAPCSSLAKVICETLMDDCLPQNVKFLMKDSSTDEIITTASDRTVFSDEKYYCAVDGDTKYFKSRTISQICGKHTHKVPCSLGFDCTIVIKRFSVERCKLSCEYVLNREYEMYKTRKVLIIANPEVDVKLSFGGKSYCLTYMNNMSYYFNQWDVDYTQAISQSSARNKKLVAVKVVNHFLEWLQEGAKLFNKTGIWYLAKNEDNCGTDCCVLESSGKILTTMKCTKKAFSIWEQRAECDPNQVLDNPEYLPQVCYPLGNKGYFFLRVKVDFYEAQRICEFRNMILPKIDNQSVLDNLRRMSNPVNINQFWWMNAQRDAKGQYYHYDNQSDVTFLPFYNEKDRKLANKRCVVIGRHFMNKWGAYGCNDLASVICEHENMDCITPPKPEQFWSNDRASNTILVGSFIFVVLCIMAFVYFIGMSYTQGKRRKRI